MSTAAVFLAAIVACSLSAACSSSFALYPGAGSSQAGGSPVGSVVDSANNAVANAAVGPAPASDKWKFVSVMVTGKVLSTLDANSTTLDDAKAKCHAQALCTHVDYWPEKKKYYLKNGSDLPQECIDGTKKCSDGDWKDGGAGGYFHPDRGWGSKAEGVEEAIKQSECSSGSSCAKTKILNILSMATIPFDILGGVAGFGAGTSSAYLTTFGRVAMAADYASDITTAAQLGSMVVDYNKKSKSDGAYPYSNMPYISPTNYTVGTGNGPSYNNFIRAKHGCSGTGSANFRTDCREWAWTPADTECKTKVRSVEYPAWEKAYSAWEKLPESEGNFNPINWKALYNSDSSPLTSCEDANKGTLSPLVNVEASAQSGRLRSSSSRAATSRPKTSRPATSRPSTTSRTSTSAPVRRTTSTSAPSKTVSR